MPHVVRKSRCPISYTNTKSKLREVSPFELTFTSASSGTSDGLASPESVKENEHFRNKKSNFNYGVLLLTHIHASKNLFNF